MMSNTQQIFDQLFSSMVLPVKPAIQATGAKIDVTDPGTVQMAEGFEGYTGDDMLANAGFQHEEAQSGTQQELHAEKE